MKKSLLLATLLAVTVLTGCTTPTVPVWEAPEPGARDENISALLPQGAFTVIGEWNKGDVPLTGLEGYVNFGSQPDGKDCSADYTLSDLNNPGKLNISEDQTLEIPSKVRVVHNAGGSTWYRDISSLSSDTFAGIPDATKPVTWADSSNPAAPVLPMMFIPAIIAADWNPGISVGAGTGELCSIPIIPRFMKLDGERLVFDNVRANATALTGRAHWAQMFVDATGLEGTERTETIEKIVSETSNTWDSLMEGHSVQIVKEANGVIEIVQTREGTEAYVLLRFTPTEPRTVEQITAQTYFEALGQEIKKLGVSGRQFVRDALGI
jgi:hypothetical protein